MKKLLAIALFATFTNAMADDGVINFTCKPTQARNGLGITTLELSLSTEDPDAVMSVYK